MDLMEGWQYPLYLILIWLIMEPSPVGLAVVAVVAVVVI
jgi:hypothetical protein